MLDRTPNREALGLEAKGISKYFSGVPALTGVSIAVRPGQIVGLAGHNGAGKSTLLKVLSGVHRPDEGSILLNGETIELSSPRAALARGIATVHQELSLLPNLSVTQNVFLAQERTRAGILQRESMRREAQAMVDRFGLDIDVTLPVGSYSVATRQLLELAIATHRNAQFLLLDEPTTSLEADQVDQLLATVRNLAKEHGVGIMLINHKLDEVYAVADHLVALVDGRVRIDGPAATVSRAEMVRAIAGDEALTQVSTASAPLPTKTGPTPPALSQEPALIVRQLKTKTLEEVTLTAHRGRVLGIYGLVGAGRTEFLRTLIGLDPVLGGEIKLLGRAYRPRNPAQAQMAGIVYLTEERKRDGIVPPLDSVMNVSLPVLHRFQRLGFLNRRNMWRSANEYLDILRVRGDRSQPITRLSGGNQQKILFARALAQDPKILLLDEPTKGVDIGVKGDIHRMIRNLAAEKQMTVLLVSSEEEEILEVADDVVVFVGGKCDGQSRPAQELNATQLRRAAWITA
jgi:ribose transport system ATP-binding protein